MHRAHSFSLFLVIAVALFGHMHCRAIDSARLRTADASKNIYLSRQGVCSFAYELLNISCHLKGAKGNFCYTIIV
jgi:hypothetical protein